MSGFSNFLIQEELRSDHAERFLLYVDRYHLEVFSDLREALAKAWKLEAKRVKVKASPDAVQAATLKNPSASLELSVDESTAKFISSRQRGNVEVSPSVKIPLVFNHEQRDLLIKKFLEVGYKTLKEVTHRWSEIFKVEKKGKAVPWFKLTHDDDEVRVQLSVKVGEQEVFKTLYSVRVEYGKVGSKLKDFDRLYLISMI